MTRRDCFSFALAPAALALAGCDRKKSPRYQGYALVANHEGKSLAVVDLSRFQRLKEISMAAPPSWVVAAPDAQKAFILSSEASTMQVFSLETLQLMRPVPLGGLPQGVRLSTDQKSLWVVLREPNGLIEFRTDGVTRATRVRLESIPGDLDENDGQVVVAFPQMKTVGLLHPRAAGGQAGRFQMSPPLDRTPALVKLRADGNVILIGNGDSQSITVVNTKPLLPVTELPLALTPKHFCMNRDGGQMFVTGPGMDAVAIVSPYQTEVGETILAGNAPGAMASTSGGPQYLFVANQNSGDVTIIDVDTRRMLAQIPVGQRPGTVLLTPDNEYALVLNEQSGDMAVIRLLMIRQATHIAGRIRTAPLFTLLAVGSAPVSGAIAPRAL